MMQMKSEGQLLENSLLFKQVDVLFYSSFDRMRPTHIMGGNRLSSEPSDSNVNVTKWLHRNTQNNVWPNI